MADGSTKKKGGEHAAQVTPAIYVRFVPIDDVDPIEATLSRQTAAVLLRQLEQQLRPESVGDDGQSTA